MRGGGQRAGSGVCQADATWRLIHCDTPSERGHARPDAPTPPIDNTRQPSNAQKRKEEARREGYPLTGSTRTQIFTALRHKSGIS